MEGGTSIGRNLTNGYVPQPSTSIPEDRQGEMPGNFTDGPGTLPVADFIQPQEDSTPPLDKPPDKPPEVRAPRPAIQSSYHVESPSASHTGMSKERAHMDMGTETSQQPGMPSEDSLDQESRSVLLYQGQDMSQPDWETSFALVSTTRPTPPGNNVSEPGYSTLTDGREQVQPFEGGGGGMVQTTGEGSNYRMVLDDDPNAVDSLHVEIQRLQARIMSRLRDTAAPPDVSFSGPFFNP